MAGRVAGKVALVTGGAMGLGKADCETLAREGAKVIVTDRDAELAHQVAAEIGGDAMALDVTSEDQWIEVMRAVQERHGGLDILVNNAGMVSSRSIEQAEMEAWGRVIGVNLTGTMLGCRVAIAAMKRNPGGASGAIVNIASTTAIAPLPTDVGYSASKAGVRAISKSVATWCAQQGLAIRCNTVIPGATDTGILSQAEKVTPGLKQAVAATSPRWPPKAGLCW